MKIVTEIEKLFVESKMTQSEIAKIMGTTQPNISKKIRTNTFYSHEIEKIADALGYDLEINFKKRQ